MDQIALAQFHPGGNYVSANTRCDSLGVPSVNILFSRESVRQITEVMMPHFPKTHTHRLNHLPRITHLNDTCKKISICYKPLYTDNNSKVCSDLLLSHWHLLSFKLLSSLCFFLFLIISGHLWATLSICVWEDSTVNSPKLHVL